MSSLTGGWAGGITKSLIGKTNSKLMDYPPPHGGLYIKKDRGPRDTVHSRLDVPMKVRSPPSPTRDLANPSPQPSPRSANLLPPFREAPKIPPKPVAVVSTSDRIVITSTSGRGIDPGLLQSRRPSLTEYAKPAYSVPSTEPPTERQPILVFPEFPKHTTVQHEPRRMSRASSEVNVDTGAPMETLSEVELSDGSSISADHHFAQGPHVIDEAHQGTAPAVLATEEQQISPNVAYDEYEQQTLEPTPEGVVEFETLQPVTPFEGSKAKAMEGGLGELDYRSVRFQTRSSSCKPFSRCTVILGLLFIIFFLGCVGIFIAWAVTSDGFHNMGGLAEVCSTKQCLDSAFRISSYTDQSIPACSNFYRYSCGNYHTQPLEQQKFYQDDLQKNTYAALYSIVSTLDEDGISTRSSRFAKQLFNSCMDEFSRLATGIQPMLELFRNLPCGPVFPDCKNFNKDKYSWERHSGFLDGFVGDYNLFVIDREIINEADRTLRLSFRPPNMDVFLTPIKQQLRERAQMHETEFEPLLAVSLRQNLLNDIVSKYLAADLEKNDRHKMIVEVSELIVEIDNATKRVDKSRTIMTIRDFMGRIPQVNITEFMNGDLTSLITWNYDDLIVVYDIAFFDELAMIAARNSKRSFANFLTIVTAIRLKEYILQHGETPSGAACAEQLSVLDPFVKLYAERQINVSLPAIKVFTDRLLSDFRYLHRNSPTTVFSPLTRVLVGYPRKIADEEFLYNQFKNVMLNESDYFYSITTSLRNQRSARMTAVGTILDEDDSTAFQPLKPNIIHSENENAIIVPLGSLQEPILLPGSESPQMSIYGTYAVMVAQLMAKVFWQNMQTALPLACFEDVFRAFLQQNLQGLYLVPDLIRTITFSDALMTAEHGYIQWQKTSGIHQEQRLPISTEMNSIQEFFVTFGTFYCHRDGFQSQSLYESMINTAVSTTQLFKKNFKCADRAPMSHPRNCFQSILLI